MELNEVLLHLPAGDRPAALPYDAVLAIGKAAADGRDALLHGIVEQAAQLCSADSAGISIFENPHYDELTWTAVTGPLRQFEGRRFPRRNSMCGVCLEHRKAQLFIYPHRHFRWMAEAGIKIETALVVPIVQRQHIPGTIWIMQHDIAPRFNAGDAQMLMTLAGLLAGHTH